MSYLTPSQILDILKGEGDLETVIKNGSPEYKNYVHYWAHILRSMYQSVIVESGYIYNRAVFANCHTRNDYIKFFQTEGKEYYEILVGFFDQNIDVVKKCAWEMCREKAENGAPFVKEFEG